MPDTQPPLTLIQQFFAKLRDNWIDDTLRTLVHPDAVFIGVREEASPTVPIYGTYRGLAQVPRFFATLRSLFDTQSFELDHVLEPNFELE